MPITDYSLDMGNHASLRNEMGNDARTRKFFNPPSIMTRYQIKSSGTWYSA